MNESLKKHKEEIINIWDNLDLKVYKTINNTLNKIELLLNNEKIGVIYKTSFRSNSKQYTNEHLYKEITPNLRRKWYWNILYHYWQKYWWELPKLEYSSKISTILFLKKHWYKIIWYYIWNQFYRWWEEFIQELKDKFKDDFIEPRLDKVFLLKKEN
jgi:hypothetical protein